jgi:hypothetical protein
MLGRIVTEREPRLRGGQKGGSPRHFWCAALAAVSLVLTGCMAGEGHPADAAPDDWVSIQSSILETNCVVCHSGSSAPMGLSFTADQYTLIVANGKTSGEVSTLKIVAPGDKSGSYLYLKIMGAAGIMPERMPRGQPPLAGGTIDRIGRWIDAGAPGLAAGGSAPPPAPVPPPAGSPEPTWDYIQANILQPRCVVCHSGTNPPAGLSWEASQYDAVVAAPRTNSAGTYYIVNPGDAANSFLAMKITGDPRSGGQMPQGGPYLDQGSQDLIKLWIDSGAVRSAGGAPVPAKPALTGTGGGGGTSPAATWDYIQANILQPRCVGCHSGTNPPAGLSWEASQYDAVVAAPRTNSAGTYYIVNPGDAANSFMAMKITGDSRSGGQMPQGGPYLDQASQDLIKLWINSGAVRGAGGAPVPAKPALTGTGGGGGTTPTATWDYIQANILKPRCVSCHSGSGAPGGLSWEANQYDAIVTYGKMDSSGTYRIVLPGNRADSYLYMKVLGDPRISGSRMPRGGTALDQASMDLIGLWIDSGAPRSAPGGGTSGGGTPPPLLQPNWDSIQSLVFQPQCVGCHGGSQPAQGLSLEADQYRPLVEDEQKSTLNREYPIIDRGHMDRSALYLKLINSPIIPGSHTGAPVLDPSVIQVIGDWIEGL